MKSNIKNCQLVSIPVIAYNSSQTIIETLNSIKAQTYPNIELIISDDYSTDNTVEICREWVEQNKERFVRTEIITVEKNTGTAGNLNRAEAVCQGEWIKGIAGDDLLMPNCIQDCMEYVAEHPETIYLFGRQKAFDADKERCKEVDEVFDYSFFNKTPEEQLHRLVFESNCVPATTVIYNREHAAKVGVKNDERIPLLEDWPKWINLIRAGVKLHFVDKVLVMYRVGGISTGGNCSVIAYRSGRLFDFYYRFPEWSKINANEAVERMVKNEVEIYQWWMESERQLYQIQHSKAYRLGKAILKPFKWMRKKMRAM